MRLGTPEDLPAFEAMLRLYLLEQASAGSPVQVTRRTVDWYRDLARSYLQGSMFGVLVLALGPEGNPVGFALAGEDLGTPRLDTTLGRTAVVWLAWVQPQLRKGGTALSMLHWGQPRLRDLGFRTAVMTVREGNAEGEALTRAFGAKPAERMFSCALGGNRG